MSFPAEVVDITENPLTTGLLCAINGMVITKDLADLAHQFENRIWAELWFVFHVCPFNNAISGKW